MDPVSVVVLVLMLVGLILVAVGYFGHQQLMWPGVLCFGIGVLVWFWVSHFVT
jgi:hypothetical protein